MGVSSEILIKVPKEGIHFTGKPIKGIVRYHLDKETAYKTISLSLIGGTYCAWYEYVPPTSARANRYKHRIGTVTNHYKCEGYETINVMKLDLLNNTTSEKSKTLSPGSYEQPFEILLPENIPPSVRIDERADFYTTGRGEIKYYLILKFKKPGLFSRNKQFKKGVDIYPSVDSSIPNEPLIFGLDKPLTKLISSKNNEITLKGELDRAYLTPSSGSRISFVVTNNSDAIISVKTESICKIKYYGSRLDQKTEEEVIDSCTAETPSVPDNSVANMFNVVPVLPEMYTIRHAKIINREYIIKVTLKLPLPHMNASVEVPVFIGSRIKANEAVEDESSEEPPSYFEAMSEDKAEK